MLSRRGRTRGRLRRLLILGRPVRCGRLVVEGRATGSEVRTIDISIGGPTGDVVGNPHEGAEQPAEKTQLLYTVYDVVVSRALSGTASPGDVIEVKQPGGAVDGTTAALSGGVLIDVGQAYTLFSTRMTIAPNPHPCSTRSKPCTPRRATAHGNREDRRAQSPTTSHAVSRLLTDRHMRHRPNRPSLAPPRAGSCQPRSVAPKRRWASATAASRTCAVSWAVSVRSAARSRNENASERLPSGTWSPT